MAISQNLLFGRMRKSIGNITTQTWNGLNVTRAKPMSVRQNVTQAVQLNRAKFAAVTSGVAYVTGWCKDFYSLGIRKTTAFADTVKFFRTRMLDTLRLDPARLAGAKFGTGNTSGLQYEITDPKLSQCVLTKVLNEGNAEFNSVDAKVSILVVNDDLSKVRYFSEEGTGNLASITFDLDSAGFEVGEKICIATKVVKLKAGQDLSGKVKFVDKSTFTTILAN